MFLKLINFKFHRDYSITIPEEGMTLLCGPSGIGKTAILNAISFVMFGKTKRPYSHTTKSCSVELTSERYKIHIIRSKNPNKLSVTYNNKKYEEKKTAQCIIDSVFKMDHSQFNISSFFDHKKRNSLISMSPSEQLSFVEKLALFNSESPTNKTSSAEDIKNIINTHKIILEKESNSTTKKIEFITLKLTEKQDILNSLNKILNEYSVVLTHTKESVINTKTVQTLDEYKKEYNNINLQIEKTNDQIRSYRKEIVILQTKEKDEKKIEIEKIKTETTLNGYLQALNELPHNITDKELTELTLLKDTLQNMCALEEKYIRDREQADWKIKKLNADIKRIESEILTSQELNNCELTISNCETTLKLINVSKGGDLEALKKDYEFIKEIVLNTSHFQKEKFPNESLLDVHREALPPKDLTIGNTVSSLVECIEEEIIETDKILRNLEFVASKKVMKCPKCSSELIENNTNHTPKNNKSKQPQLLCFLSKEEKEILFDQTIRKSIQENIICVESKLDMLLSQLETCKKCLVLDTIINTQNGDLMNRDCISPQEIIMKNKLMVSDDKMKKDELIRLKKELSNVVKEKIDIPKNPKCLADVKKELGELESTIKDAFHSKGERSRLNRNIETYKKSLLKFKANVNCDLSGNLKEDKFGVLSASYKIEKITKDIQPLEELNLELNKKLNILKKSEEYIRTSNNITTIKEEIFSLIKDKEELSIRLTDIETKIKGSIGLEISVREAELLAVVNVLNNINIRANEYLSDLFDNHIDVRLRIKKETKSGKTSAKPSIELNVVYRGNVYDDIDDEISGGERQRIDLAFLFAVNDIIGSNIILLDECFNNLHPEVNTQILTYISNSPLFEGKQIVIISHEAIHGVFNKIIHLSEMIEV